MTPDHLTRQAAAAHLRSLGYKIAPQTLANRQVKGTGPTYHSLGWRSGYYTKAELEAWAAEHCERLP